MNYFCNTQPHRGGEGGVAKIVAGDTNEEAIVRGVIMVFCGCLSHTLGWLQSRRRNYVGSGVAVIVTVNTTTHCVFVRWFDGGWWIYDWLIVVLSGKLQFRSFSAAIFSIGDRFHKFD